jgi:putative phosphoesterase
MVRMAVVSDIHGNLPALEAVIADIKRRKPDIVVNLGDCVSGPLWPRETCEMLRQLDWRTVRGNCDRCAGENETSKASDSDRFAYEQLDESAREWLIKLPKTIQLSDRILACHGTPFSDEEFLIENIVGGQLAVAPSLEILRRLGATNPPMVLCGHSHIPNFIMASPTQFVLNPGSVGLPAFDAGTVDGVRVVSESGSPHARYAVLIDHGTHFDVEHHAITYNHRMAVERAREMNRHDYGLGLDRGMMR